MLESTILSLTSLGFLQFCSGEEGSSKRLKQCCIVLLNFFYNLK